MRSRNLFWLVGAIAVAAATLGLAALVVVFVPNDPSAATAAQQQQLERKVESIVESHRQAR